MFRNNKVAHLGGAIYARKNSHIYFKANSSTLFINNTAFIGGAIYSKLNGQISLKENSSAELSNNTATNCGGAIYSGQNSYIKFEGNSSTKLYNNNAVESGGAIYSDYSQLFYEGKSSAVFSDNTAGHGGSIYCKNGHVSFETNSSTVFSNNIVEHNGGAMYSYNGSIYFADNSSTVLDNNTAIDDGGALYALVVNITFDGNSEIIFSNNDAYNGGAVFSSYIIAFKGSSSIVFKNNKAYSNGGAIRTQASNISFEELSCTVFTNNTSDGNGGATYLHTTQMSFNEFSNVTFRKNTAHYGGAVFAKINCVITFSDNSIVTFTENSGTDDTIVYSIGRSKIVTKENSIVMTNGHTARWCNIGCLPYYNRRDVAVIDSDGIVQCEDYKYNFECLSKTCNCRGLQEFVTDSGMANVTAEVVTLDKPLVLEENNYTLIGHNNPTVICVKNSHLILRSSYNVTIEGINWVGCGGNFFDLQPAIFIALIRNGFTITIQKCSFKNSRGSAIEYDIRTSNTAGDIIINHCNFTNNNYFKGHGAAIFYRTLYGNLTISNCNFNYNQILKSVIFVEKQVFPVTEDILQVYINSCNFCNIQGVAVYLSNSINLYIDGEVLFDNNEAENGAGIYASYHTLVVFDKSSTVNFMNNKVTNGTIYSKHSSNVTFTGNCHVTFSNNLARNYGAAIYSFNNSHVTFTENAKANFSNNDIPWKEHQHGGTIFSEAHSYIIFENNSITVFSKNTAKFGSAIFSYYKSHTIFQDNSWVNFNNNMAGKCGALTAAFFSTISYYDNTQVIYNSNTMLCTANSRSDESSAGTICTFTRADVILSGHSFITFINNTAHRGGALVLFGSSIVIKENSVVKFHANTALNSGGALECSNNSNVAIKGDSKVVFANNKASENGGAIHLYNSCHIIFKGNSTLNFINNVANINGGAILGTQNSVITFKGNSTVSFDSNTAGNGGVLYLTNSIIVCKEKSVVSFYNNEAKEHGGVGYVILNSTVLFDGFTKVNFENNTSLYGGAISANNFSNVTLTGSSLLKFFGNTAVRRGGVAYFYSQCNLVVKENALVMFNNSEALQGGAICVDDRTKLLFEGNSTTLFYNNKAFVGGGAVKALNESYILINNRSIISFTENVAQYGGAIFVDTTVTIVNSSDDTQMYNNKAAFLGNTLYQDVTKSCNEGCITNKSVGIRNEFITTSPNVLKLYNPAVCINNDGDTHCNNYYVKNIMLGREIIISACVLDYYNKSITESTQFLIHSEANQDYFLAGPKEVLISCDAFQGIHIKGNKILLTSINFSVNISLNVDHDAGWKQISTNLIIGLSPCQLGFWQYPESQICECFNADDIVFCSSNSSTIKGGYWFGNLTGKPTVAFCPINYCNFTCCQISDNYYHLSPIRDNQCKSHRSGTACGSCSYGYTLSFDSPECVSIERCTAGEMVLVILLTMAYWIVIIMLVFAMMYYRVGIGYLYSIMYYYSIVGILLSQRLQGFRELFLAVNIISSFTTITPRFLGELCLITGMSGIDQQIIHYLHPLAIIITLIAISFLARKSRKVSSIISRGIIHVLCLLLLSSYNSIASTSLLLIRPLTFHEIDKVYTYLSPDIEYFHGRHLAYGIVALLCIVSIVIGLPLLLTLEPYINRKINFAKIKPLLDQFQGCYKGKCRCFAGYYMICRLVIISVVVGGASNDLVTNYLLIIVSVIIALMHVLFKPYSIGVLNILDGIVLHAVILIASLPLLSADITSPLAITLTLLLLTIPLLCFTTVIVSLFKDHFISLISKCKSHNDNEVSLGMTNMTADDSVRVNETARGM